MLTTDRSMLPLTMNDWTAINKLRRDEVFSDHMCEDWTFVDWGLAMAGEAGEVCNVLKKKKRGDRITDEQIKEEIGGLMVYIALLADSLGLSLQDCCVYAFNDVSKRRGSKYVI